MQLHENMVFRSTRDYRQLGEYLQDHLDLLPCRDKALMNLYLKYGPRYREIAQVIGIHEGNISRRIKKIIRVLLENAAMQKSVINTGLSPLHVSIAQGKFISGLSYSQLAQKHCISVHQIRIIIADFKKHYPATMKLSRPGVQHAHV